MLGWRKSVCVPVPRTRPLPGGDARLQLRVIDIKLTAEPSPSYFAEVAYYRLLFLEGSGAAMGVVTTSLTAFTAPLRTSRGVDLSRPPFDAFRSEIASPSTYVSSQSLGRAMRDARVEAFRYPSARDREGGVNVAAIVPSVFGSGQPRSLETWYCAATREGVDVSRADFLRKQRFDFPRAHFLVRGKLPAPAI